MRCEVFNMDNKQPPSLTNNVSKRVILNQITKDVTSNSDLWTDGLICAFEFVRGQRPPSLDKSNSRTRLGNRRNDQTYDRKDSRRASKNLKEQDSVYSSSILELNSKPPVLDVDEAVRLSDSKDKDVEPLSYSHWIPIGWSRISELVQKVKVDEHCVSQQMNFANGDDHTTVADVATPYWERPEGPTWWCHVAANHPSITSWLNNAQWLYPAISVALRDESRLISERMKYLLYEVPVRVAGGLLFELLGQSVGDPFSDEDDIPVVLRSWQAQNFLLSSLHIKGSAANINVLGITEVQELLLAGGTATPKSIQEVIAHLTSRLTRWDDRLFRKYVFGAADEIELKFVNRRNHEDMNMLCVILNREIRKLAMQHVEVGCKTISSSHVYYYSENVIVNELPENVKVIRVKWSLHAREEIVFELLQHLKGPITRSMLEGIRKSTREMLDEQEAVRGRLFTIQDVMQSTVRAWLQDKSLRVTHNLAIFGGCGLVLSIITGLFGINVDGIPGAENTPYAFALFTGILLFVGFVLIGLGMLYLGLKKPINETKVNIRKMELERMVSVFQHEAETHAKVRQDVSRHNLPPTAADTIHDADYILID